MNVFDLDSFTIQQKSLDLSLFVLSNEKEIPLTLLSFSQLYHSF